MRDLSMMKFILSWTQLMKNLQLTEKQFKAQKKTVRKSQLNCNKATLRLWLKIVIFS